MFTHPDLPVQNISGDVDSSHGLSTINEKYYFDVPVVKVQVTSVLCFFSCAKRHRAAVTLQHFSNGLMHC